ncbi:MAG: hypothetical protein QOI80_3778 [Solirubrobacteraceae bacterium]|nr:hypothetical protein [Solirubrobacteraceae bacterium]
MSEPAPPLGLAHVASCSFLASRLAPSGQFFLALGGGVALARAAFVGGLRAGYGASVAAMVQTVALIGPARFNAPLTQALNAPVIGRMQAKGASRAARLAACLAIRLVHYAILNVIFVTLVVGGLDEYVATYDKIAGWLHFLPKGQTAAVGLTVVGSIVYGLAFSTIQVLVCERALDRWPAPADADAPAPAVAAPAPRERPRRVFGAPVLVAIAWVALLAHLTWPVVAVVAGALAVLALGTDARRAGRAIWTVGLVLATVLAISALIPGLIGAVDLEPAGQRAARAALMALTATWARAYAGSDGLREFARRILWGEAARLIAQLESDTRLRPAADDLIERLGKVDTKPVPLADALTEWVAAEARGYRPPG